MKNFRIKHLLLSFAVLVFTISGCTKLEDTLVSNTDENNPAVAISAVNVAYQQMQAITNQANTYALLEHSSDEMVGPTRGTDWDDNGTWRRLHLHTWDSQHNQVQDTWDDLSSGVAKANAAIDLSTVSKSTSKLAVARFLRAFFMYYLVDLYGKAQIRFANSTSDNPTVFSRSQATDLIIADLRAALPVLPTGTANATLATKEAASFLLAKMYLNKAVYKQDPTKPAGPYTFAKSDMDSVVFYSNAIIANTSYSLTTKNQYFDMFSSSKQSSTSEIILSLDNSSGNTSKSVRNRYYMTLHYNQKPSAWNGFTTLADFYNSFEASDARLGTAYPGLTDVTGVRAGFLVGQQYDKDGKPLNDRNGIPLAFTPTLSILNGTSDGNSASSVEIGGIRVIKYLPIPNAGNFDNITTNYVFYRYSDVILMKAEALLRGSSDPVSALTLVNSIRTNRGLTPLATIDLPGLLAERGHELYWEGWRRNDQIRFGTFLNPENTTNLLNGRGTKSADYRVVFPIAQRAVDANPDLKQNFGY